MHFYTLLAADLGSFTVIAAKAVSTFLQSGFTHNVQTMPFWTGVIVLVTCAILSTMFLNEAMHYFDAAKVRH